MSDWATGAMVLLGIVAVVNVGSAWVLWRHVRYPYCPECSHCREEEHRRKLREEADRREWERMLRK